MKAKVYDSGSIKTVLVQDDNGDKFITGLGELLDMMDGEDNWEIETTSGNTLTGKLYKYNELLKKEEREDMKGGEKEPTLDVLFVFFNVKDIEGKPVPHFMVPSLTTNNDYIMEEGCDDPASLVKKALGDYKLSAGDMEYLGWEGDTPPRITKEDVKDMVHVDDRVLVTRKVPRKLIARE